MDGGCMVCVDGLCGAWQRFLVARGFDVDRAMDMYSKWVACSERVAAAVGFIVFIIVAGRWRRGCSCRWTPFWKTRTPSRHAFLRLAALHRHWAGDSSLPALSEHLSRRVRLIVWGVEAAGTSAGTRPARPSSIGGLVGFSSKRKSIEYIFLLPDADLLNRFRRAVSAHPHLPDGEKFVEHTEAPTIRVSRPSDVATSQAEARLGCCSSSCLGR